MEIKLGDIYWLKTKGDIAHPHVVIKINELEDKYTVCSVTSNMKKIEMPGNILLNIDEGSLNIQSIVEVSKVFIVSKKLLKEYIGSLDSDRVKEIHKGIGLIKRSFLNN